MLDYFRRYAVNNEKLRELYMGTQSALNIMNAELMALAKKQQLAKNVRPELGVHGLPEVQKALKEGPTQG